MVAGLVDPMSLMRGADPLERFMSKVSPEPNTGCWLWMAGVDKDGYGKFQTGPRGAQRHWRAHHFIFQATKGPIPPGRLLMHTCDNGALGCVNPEHLRPGTWIENRLDCVRKGRHARGDRSGPRRHPERMRFLYGDAWRRARGLA